MARVCLDTSAWLEYFNDGPNGPQVKALVESSERVVTPASVAAELVEAARRRRLNTKMFIQFLRAKSDVVAMNAEVARLAGRINAQHQDDEGWTMMESFVLATAQYARCRLYTRDPLFSGSKNVVMLSGLRRAGAHGASASGTKAPG